MELVVYRNKIIPSEVCLFDKKSGQPIVMGFESDVGSSITTYILECHRKSLIDSKVVPLEIIDASSVNFNICNFRTEE